MIEARLIATCSINHNANDIQEQMFDSVVDFRTNGRIGTVVSRILWHRDPVPVRRLVDHFFRGTYFVLSMTEIKIDVKSFPFPFKFLYCTKNTKNCNFYVQYSLAMIQAFSHNFLKLWTY